MENSFHYLSDEHLFVFLAQLLVLLGLARGLGHVCARLGQPALLGEILTGVMLGPTLLGRVAPDLRAMLFPNDVLQHGMLDTVAWIGLFLMLLAAGLEVDVSVAWRQRGDALKISLSDVVLPMAVAFVPALLLPDRYLAEGTSRWLFAVFIATVMTISALPMSVRVLHDLDLLKSDLGLLIISALTINDIIGWAIFTLVLGYAARAGMGPADVALVLGAVVLFSVGCLTLGRRVVGAAVSRIPRHPPADTGLILTFVCCLGLVAGLATQGMGIHALFGFFLAGLMVGDAPAVSERTRHVISQMVYAVFVPVFFASIALQIDFLANFDVLLVGLLTVVGVGGRYAGAWVGARMTALSRWDRVTVAIAHTPGGSMEMVMAFVALQLGLVTVPVFVAIVFSALASSLLLGPWMAWSLRRRTQINLLEVFLNRAMPVELRGGTRWQVIEELCAAAAEAPGAPPVEALVAAVRAREETAGTALGNGLAVPHARLPGLARPVVVAGRAHGDVEWNAPDGLPVHLAFLILTPPEPSDLQVQILAGLARGLVRPEARERVMAAPQPRDAQDALRTALGGQALVRKPA